MCLLHASHPRVTAFIDLWWCPGQPSVLKAPELFYGERGEGWGSMAQVRPLIKVPGSFQKIPMAGTKPSDSDFIGLGWDLGARNHDRQWGQSHPNREKNPDYSGRLIRTRIGALLGDFEQADEPLWTSTFSFSTSEWHDPPCSWHPWGFLHPPGAAWLKYLNNFLPCKFTISNQLYYQ